MRGEDRWVSIAVLTDDEWRGLVTAMGAPAWATEPRFDTVRARRESIDEIHAQLAQWTRDFDDVALAADLQDHGVAAAPVLNVADLLHNPHYRARQTFIEVSHPLGFTKVIYGSYVKTSRTVPKIAPGPAMGRDNERVLRELLGLSKADYEQLVAEGVID